MRHGAKYLLVTTILLAGYCAALQHKTLVPQPPRARVTQPAAPLAANAQEATTSTVDSQPPLPLVALADTERAAPLDKRTEPFAVNKQPTIERAAPPPEIADSFQRPFDWSVRPAETPSPEPSTTDLWPEQRGVEKTAAAKSAKPAAARQKPTATKTADRKGSEKKSPAKVATGDRKATAAKPAAQPKLADRKAAGDRPGGSKVAKTPKPADDRKAKKRSEEAESQGLVTDQLRPSDADAFGTNPANTTPYGTNPADTTPFGTNRDEPQADTTQERPAASLQRHCIAPGDTLAKLAEKYWGDASQAAELYRANESILPDPRLLPIGVEIEIPPRQATAPQQPAGDASNTEPAPDHDASGLIPVPPSMRHLPPVDP
jgi:hypothetical protein